LCVGEKERTAASTYFDFIKEQLKVGLADVTAPKLSRVVIAYEPVWAIGATTPMSSRDMHEMAIFIRKTIVGLFGEKGMLVKILYGGSIDALSAPDMLTHGDVAGLLVGRASTTAQSMTDLVRSLKNI
jgi:triosephosphate isomerase